MRLLFIPSLFAIACGPAPSTIEGTVAGLPFENVGTAMWGGRYLVLVNQPIECIDMAWVHRNYSEGAELGDTDFVALQFTFGRGQEVSESPLPYSVQGVAEVSARAIDYSDGIFDAGDEYRGLDGLLFVDDVKDKKLAVGSFEIEFPDDEKLVGDFSADWCVNLPD